MQGPCRLLNRGFLRLKLGGIPRHPRMIFATDTLCQKHDPGHGHPEQVARCRRVELALRESGLEARMQRVPARVASEEDLRLVHEPGYLQLAQREIEFGYDHLSTGDTQVCLESWAAAKAAVGCAIAATEAVMRGLSKTAFGLVRPPGHHANAAAGRGFCVLNNVAVAARYAQRRFGLRRVLIVDWDVHHGNGTQDIFYGDGSVFFFSTHQSPWYPGTGLASETGEGEGIGATLNCPLPAGSGRSEVLACFEKKLVPAMQKFRPELVLISAGFDSRKGDPLGRFELEDTDFADLTRLAREIADQSAEGRVVSLLEGGYSLEGLAAGVSAHVQALL
jgi:acetoin utilization deacetylase AcuC-like enzyme